MSTAILLGAGSSISAGFPCTQDLTDLVLSGQGVYRHTDSSYYIDLNSNEPRDGTTDLVIKMVNRLHAEMIRYFAHYGMDREPNYEEIAYLADQVCDQWSGELDNPIILPFIERLKTEMSSDINDLENYNHKVCVDHSGNKDLLASLIEETRNYIADLVWRSLLRNTRPKRQPRILKDICHKFGVTSISTLCHDNHLETFLKDEGIGINDGYCKQPDAGIRYWNGDFTANDDVLFLKLHGSIDWFELYQGGSFYEHKIGCLLSDADCWRLETAKGDWISTPGRPMFLIGTFNKITQYSSGVFRSLHWNFRSSISTANPLIVCGYSFNDKGINSEVIV